MSNSPRPCAHCGNTTFHYLPEMRSELDTATTILGMSATKHVKGQYWAYTLVVCTNCGFTQVFTLNAAQMVSLVPNAMQISASPR